MLRISRKSCLLAAGFGILLMACEDDPVRSDLNSEGPPRVVTITAVTETELDDGDPAKFLPEEAFFCSTSADDKVNRKYCAVGSTPRTIDDVPPFRSIPDQTDVLLPTDPPEHVLWGTSPWYIRVVFNELLDPDRAEELLPCIDATHDGSCEDEDALFRNIKDDFGNPILFGSLKKTNPVTLLCNGAEISYDGWYDPSGNHLSDPPGPALIIVALQYQGTVTNCELGMNAGVLFDKDNNPLSPIDPILFSTASLKLRSTSPRDGTTGVSREVTPRIIFNGLIDPNTLAANIEFTGGTTPPVFTPSTNGKTSTVTLTHPEGTMLEPETEYTITVKPGITDTKGAVLGGSDVTFKFTTTK